MVPTEKACAVLKLGLVRYHQALELQERLATERQRERMGDVLLLLQHPPVITLGRAGGEEDILMSPARLTEMGVEVHQTDRGGKATCHGPGQLVAYPIVKLPDDDVHAYVRRLEDTVIELLAGYGLAAGRIERYPGVWLGGNKIAALGIAVREGVTRHGLALNVDPDMSHFGLINPCGITNRGVTSLRAELGRAVALDEVEERFIESFGRVFGQQMIRVSSLEELVSSGERRRTATWPVRRLEEARWLVCPAPDGQVLEKMETLLSELYLHTICQSARCPNIGECFAQGTATFMILGDVCTRNCHFCAVDKGRPRPPDSDEPERVAQAAARLGLRHVVVTSVTRDDLLDGGAAQFAATVRAVRRQCPEVTVELLIPDFGGTLAALRTVLSARPDVLNHNMETVSRLYPRVRPGASYRRSLGVLAWARRWGVVTKSGLMLGLRETREEVLQVMRDLRGAGCDILTLGQYLQPSSRQLPVVEYIPPEDFYWYEKAGEKMGFSAVAAGPLVRSSHRAAEVWARAARKGG